MTASLNSPVNSPRSVSSILRSSSDTTASANTQPGSNPLIYDAEQNFAEAPSPTTLRWQFIKDDLRQNEAQFMRYNDYSIWAGTWNVNGRDVGTSLYPWMVLRDSTSSPDIVFVALQEVDRRPESYLITAPSKEAAWNSFLLENIQSTYHPQRYALVVSRTLVGIYGAMIVKDNLVAQVSNVSTATAACGFGGLVGNKGGVGIRAKVGDQYVCFVGCHLAPHVDNVWRRNRDYADIAKRLVFVPDLPQSLGPRSTSDEMISTWNDQSSVPSIWDSSLLIWAGDLNYRINMPLVETQRLADAGGYEVLLTRDQLHEEVLAGRAFATFAEGAITFPPSFKYMIDSDSFETNTANPRAPAWTDRVLFRKCDRVEVREYNCCTELRGSDHRPVSCLFGAQIGVIDPAFFEKAYTETLRKLDFYENETIPATIVSHNALQFGESVFGRPTMQAFELVNTGQVIAKYNFIPRPGRTNINPRWAIIRPTHGILYPGYSAEIRVYLRIDHKSAYEFNNRLGQPEDILILHVEGGKDHFVQGPFTESKLTSL